MSEKLRSHNRDRKIPKWKRLVALGAAAISLLPLSSSSYESDPNLPPSTKIVATGDSCTSGHANGAVEGIYDECFIDPASYAYQLAEYLGVEDFTNVACSGASIEEIVEGRYGLPSQLDAVDQTTDYIFITAGANVVNITELFEQCVHGHCTDESEIFTGVISKLQSDDFKEDLKSLYLAFANKAPNASIIVIPYGELFDARKFWLMDIVGQDTRLPRLIDQYQKELNAAIKRAVREVRHHGKRVILAPVAYEAEVYRNLGTTVFTDQKNPRALGHFNQKGNQIIMKESALEGVKRAISQRKYDGMMDISRPPAFLIRKEN